MIIITTCLARLGSPQEHTHTELGKSITPSCHHSQSSLIVHGNNSAKRISGKKPFWKFQKVNNILHQNILRLQVINNIHKHNHLLVLWVFQWCCFVSKAIKSTYALTRRTTANNINISLRNIIENSKIVMTLFNKRWVGYIVINRTSHINTKIAQKK